LVKRKNAFLKVFQSSYSFYIPLHQSLKILVKGVQPGFDEAALFKQGQQFNGQVLVGEGV
jgi:hypothetical protein